MNNPYESRSNMFQQVHAAVHGRAESIVEDAQQRGLLPSVLTEDGNYTGMEESDFIGPIHPTAAEEFIDSLR